MQSLPSTAVSFCVARSSQLVCGWARPLHCRTLRRGRSTCPAQCCMHGTSGCCAKAENNSAPLFGGLYRCCASEFHALSNAVYSVSTIVRTVVCCVNVACYMNVTCCMNGACCCVARRTLHAVARQPSAAALPPNTVAENTHRHCSGSCGVQGERLVHKHVGDRRVRSRHGNHHLRRRRLPGGAFVSRCRRQRKQADLRLWADQGAL